MKQLLLSRVLLLPVLLCLVPLPSLAEGPAAATSKPAASPKASAGASKPAKGAPASAELAPEVVETMNKLVDVAVTRRALGDIAEGHDDFLPYGVLLLSSGETRLVSWQKPNPPPALDVLKGIFVTMQRQVQQDLNIVAAVTISPSGATTEEGKLVKGIRCEVDHRKGEPRIVFIPYAVEAGKVVTGTPIYLASTNPVFPHLGKNTAGAAKPSSPKGK